MKLWCILLLFACVSTAQAGPPDPWTWDDVRFGGVVEQGLDNSCGLASLLTIMHMQFGDTRYDEQTLLKKYMEDASAEELALSMKDGLSLLELEKLAKSLGYMTAKKELSFDGLSHLVTFVPVLVYLEVGRLRHFAVVRGTNSDEVMLADPSRGIVEYPQKQFLAEWQTSKGSLGLVIVRSKGGYAEKLLKEPSADVPASFIEMERQLMRPH